jgi:3-keto-L-gulonate-6-phosphate decarboxylase
MTCKQMGGPCDAQLHGETADKMIASGAAHVQEMAAKGDEEHKKVQKMMEEMQKNPNSNINKEWTARFNMDFAALPED